MMKSYCKDVEDWIVSLTYESSLFVAFLGTELSRLTDRDYVSTDHEAYVLGEGSNKVHQGWALVWWPSQDETLWSEGIQIKFQLKKMIRQILWREIYILTEVFGHSPKILDMILNTRQRDGV